MALLALAAACGQGGAPDRDSPDALPPEPDPLVHQVAPEPAGAPGRVALELAPVAPRGGGAGPEEEAPSRVSPPEAGMVPGTRLYAVDTGERRVTVFAAAGGGLEREGEFRLPLAARDLCLLGERIFLMSLDHPRSRVLHEVDRRGRLLRSFGGAHPAADVPEEWKEVVSEQMTEGPVACGEAAGLVILAGQSGIVRAFSPDGELRWARQLGGFGRTRYGVLPNGALQHGTDPQAGGNHRVSSVAILSPDRLLVRLVFHPAETALEEATTHEARVLSLSDGRELATVRGLPQISEVAPRRAPGYADLPFPQFLVLPAAPPLPR